MSIHKLTSEELSWPRKKWGNTTAEESSILNYPAKCEFLKKWVPYQKSYSFCCFPLHIGCIIVAVLTFVFPLCDIVQILEYLTDSSNEFGDQECQWSDIHQPLSIYVFHSPQPALMALHLSFGFLYLTLSYALVYGVAAQNEVVILAVLVGGLVAYMPSVIVYAAEMYITNWDSFPLNSPGIWLVFLSPLIWFYFVSVVHGYFRQLEFEKYNRERTSTKAENAVQRVSSPTSLV